MSRPILLLTLLLLALASGGAAEARTDVAIQDDKVTWWPALTIGERAELIAETGAGWSRVDVIWRDVAPTKPAQPEDPFDPAYRWERLDATMRALDVRGVKVLVSVYHSPSWATPGRDDPRWAPDPEQYAAFMVALGLRYSGDLVAGLMPAPGPPLPVISHFEIWNEPNLDFFFRPQWRRVKGEWTPASPALYARLVEAVHPRLKRARPDATIIIGALGPTNTTNPPGTVGIEDFVTALADRGVPAEAVSQHIYPGAEPGKSGALPSIQGIPRILALWDGLKPDLPLYITETGYTTAANENREYFVDDETQAEYLPRLLAGLDQPRVKMVVWYHLQDHEKWASGLLDIDGQRKPSWDAFDTARQQLEG